MKNKIIYLIQVLSILCFLLLCLGCPRSTPPQIIPPEIKTVREQYPIGCCENGYSVYIHNYNIFPLKVTIKESPYCSSCTDAQRARYKEREFTETVSAKSKKRIGCTPKKIHSDHACNLSYSYTIKKYNALKSKIGISELRSISAKERILLASTTSNIVTEKLSQTVDCDSECIDIHDGTGECFYISDLKSDLNQDYKLSTNKLLNIIGNSNDIIINKQTIMKMFYVEEDPCNRGDINISNGSLSNTGEECFLKIDFASGIPQDTKLKFLMPSIIMAKLEYGNNYTTAIFSETEKAPILKFHDPIMHNDYGGIIFRIKWINNLLILTTSNGCIGVKL